jgi:hypothetical protein
MVVYSSSKPRRQLSSKSKDQEEPSSAHVEGESSVGLSKLHLQVDFAEIRLEDVEEDGPILRAALA